MEKKVDIRIQHLIHGDKYLSEIDNMEVSVVLDLDLLQELEELEMNDPLN